jgi:ABC-type uncharacterized transport system ATPase subunit
LTSVLIEFSHVTKKYGTLLANDDLCFSVNKGEIHAIIGENGAGKSTAMKLLFGLETLTSGIIKVNGASQSWTSPRGAMASGLGMVHQHFMLSPVHSALDNVILGQEQLKGHRSQARFLKSLRPIDRKSILRELEELSAAVGFRIPWQEPVEHLPVGIQQQLEIAKLLYAGVEVMIFDEPTAVLSPEETETFLNMIRNLNQRGRTIIIITHKLREVKSIADRVTVLRRGKTVCTANCGDVTVQDMADLMVGRHVHLGELTRSEKAPGDELLCIERLTIEGLGSRPTLTDVSLSVKEGQVVGIAGVEGSGQSELFSAVLNPRRALRASAPNSVIRVFGQDGRILGRNLIRQQAIGVVPADRLREAVLPEETLIENELLGHDHEFAAKALSGYQWIDRKKARERLVGELKTFDVRPPDPDARLGGFSGGNQQKFVMARELSRNPKLILCSQPTRGVDVGAIEQIHGELLNRRDKGAGILLISSQLDELMALSDVIHVMYSGKIMATFNRQAFSEHAIGLAMGGGGKSS